MVTQQTQCQETKKKPNCVDVDQMNIMILDNVVLPCSSNFSSKLSDNLLKSTCKKFQNELKNVSNELVMFYYTHGMKRSGYVSIESLRKNKILEQYVLGESNKILRIYSRFKMYYLNLNEGFPKNELLISFPKIQVSCFMFEFSK